jgi:predicted nucleic acid-binding protein
MTFVVDTSIIIRLLAARPHDAPLRQELAQKVHAPHLIDAEVASAIRGLAITSKPEKQLTAARARQMLADYADLRIVRHPMQPVHHRVFALRANYTSYDAFYVALAEGLGIPLLTDDAKFGKGPDGVHKAEIRLYQG